MTAAPGDGGNGKGEEKIMGLFGNGRPMGWRSPRQDAEKAVTLGEQICDLAEEQLGRPLTAEEMAAYHEQARDVASQSGRQARREDEGA